MKYKEIIRKIKMGERVARKSWTNSYVLDVESNKLKVDFKVDKNDDNLYINNYCLKLHWLMKTNSGFLVPYTPTNEDTKADDWYVLTFEEQEKYFKEDYENAFREEWETWEDRNKKKKKNIKYNYTDLISEITEDIENGTLSLKDKIQILRGNRLSKGRERYSPIICWYYNENTMDKIFEIEINNETSNDLKEMNKSVYLEDKPLLKTVTVKKALDEMNERNIAD